MALRRTPGSGRAWRGGRSRTFGSTRARTGRGSAATPTAVAVQEPTPETSTGPRGDGWCPARRCVAGTCCATGRRPGAGGRPPIAPAVIPVGWWVRGAGFDRRAGAGVRTAGGVKGIEGQAPGVRVDPANVVMSAPARGGGVRGPGDVIVPPVAPHPQHYHRRAQQQRQGRAGGERAAPHQAGILPRAARGGIRLTTARAPRVRAAPAVRAAGPEGRRAHARIDARCRLVPSRFFC